MQVSCGGQGTAWALPGLRGRLGPERTPAKSPALAPVAPVASPGSCHGAWSCSRGPRHAAGECLLQTPSTGGRGCLHGEGGWSLGDRGLSGHSRFFRSLDRTLEGGSRQVHVCLLGAGGGSLSQGRTLNRQAGLRPESPRENPSVGVGSANMARSIRSCTAAGPPPRP